MLAFVVRIKFSIENSQIYVFFFVGEDDLKISFVNQASLNTHETIGIPEEYGDLIFEPFFRLHRHVFERYETNDYGLGLSLSRLIMERHRGKIAAENLQMESLSQKSKRMAGFTLTLPFKS